MRIFLFLLTLAITIFLCIILNSQVLLPAALGKLLSPQHGIWQNAESSSHNFSEELEFTQLKGNSSVYFDERLVPHVFAEQENDAYFIQGYLHAKFRLFQMDLQTRAAAGRASELVGSIALDHDREFRRLGMVYGAENSLVAMESDPVLKQACDAYTSGVNAYIENLPASQLPIEYKLLDLYPEKWSNLKTALFLKYMSHNLAGYEQDFQMTKAKNYFKPDDFKMLFPAYQDSLDPIIPNGTVFSPPGLILTPPVDYDTIDRITTVDKDPVAPPDVNNGSNNWAVAPMKTRDGAAILCNDPHLGINLPSLWFEMQISTPDFSANGVSFPGAPSIIIGYNDHIAWGVTNGGRDVRDYYEIQFKDAARQEYWFDSSWVKTTFRYEKIKVKNAPDYSDTVAYTVFGPVMYDHSFHDDKHKTAKQYAVTWTAHKAGKELLTFIQLNKAKNYSDYLSAISNMHTPGQNFVFASKSGDIAMKTQGEWPAKWKGQGDFIMPGTDSSYMWQGNIPDSETPSQYNPARGFVSSANQRPVDSTYPYYLGRHYPLARGVILNRLLTAATNVTSESMMKLQTDNYNVFAEWAVPVIMKNLNLQNLDTDEQQYAHALNNWDRRNDPGSKGATLFHIVWNTLYKQIYADEYSRAPENTLYPSNSTLLAGLLKDSLYKFADNISTTPVESVSDVISAAFKSGCALAKQADKENKLQWATYKDTRIKHLLKLDQFSRLHLPIGGGEHILNATREDHGPSWRMVVNLKNDTEAFGVYPGGQSGNPGSRFYDMFIDKWAKGEFYSLWHMKKEQTKDKRILFSMHFKHR